MRKTVWLFRDSFIESDALTALGDVTIQSPSIDCYVLFEDSLFETAEQFGQRFKLELCWKKYIGLELFRPSDESKHTSLFHIPDEVLKSKTTEIAETLFLGSTFFLSDNPAFPDQIVPALKHRESPDISSLPVDLEWKDAAFAAGALLICQVITDDGEIFPHVLDFAPRASEDFSAYFEQLIQPDTEDRVEYNSLPKAQISLQDLFNTMHESTKDYTSEIEIKSIVLPLSNTDIKKLLAAIINFVTASEDLSCYLLYEGKSFVDMTKFSNQFRLKVCWQHYFGIRKDQANGLATTEYKGWLRVPLEILKQEIENIYHHMPKYSFPLLCLSKHNDFPEKAVNVVKVRHSMQTLTYSQQPLWETEAIKAGAQFACMTVYDNDQDRANSSSLNILAFPATISHQTYTQFEGLLPPKV